MTTQQSSFAMNARNTYEKHTLSNAHLDALEEETIFILREVAAAFERPALLFSGGKDSLVMLKCAEKAFGVGRIPYPLLMIDTGHNFPEVIAFLRREGARRQLYPAYRERDLVDGTLRDLAVGDIAVARRHGLDALAIPRADEPRHIGRAHPRPRLVSKRANERREPPLEIRLPAPVHGRPSKTADHP